VPLIPNCGNNPINGGAEPPVPNRQNAGQEAPQQGDHVFGDTIGAVRNALMRIVGGGQVWETRLEAYSGPAREAWNTLYARDLGHAANPPLVHRQGAPETDEHSYMFGRQALRFQFAMCELVCQRQGQPQRIGGATRRWRSKVMGEFDTLMTVLVDGTALDALLAHPNQVRQADPANIRHPAISKQAAQDRAANGHGNNAARILNMCGAYALARNDLETIIFRFAPGLMMWDDMNDRWIAG